MQLDAHGLSHVGHVRDHNEDSFHVGERLFVVADGVGGHAAGEVASALAVETLKQLEEASPDTPESVRKALRESIADANTAVLDDAAAHPERAGMGTTLTALVVVGEQAVLGHCGDSRAYRLRDDVLEQMSTDHTAVQEAVEEGILTPEQAHTHPARHTLTRAIGLDAEPEIDVSQAHELRQGDRWLLCSDGLTEVVHDDALALALGGANDPERTAQQLVDAALAGGGPDNITVVLMTVRPREQSA